MATRGANPGSMKTATLSQAHEATEQVPAKDRENPDKLAGEALRVLAHRRGLARSSLPSMSDEKIREQLRLITYSQYADDLE